MIAKRLVAIVGPTATGKSAIALELAASLGGEIVNGDSRQVYRRMAIGTASPAEPDRRRVPHHLYDFVDPRDAFSLARFIKEARAVLEDCWSRGALPWLVGGTGQYVWALLEGWSVPEVAPDESLRSELTAFAAENGAVALHHRLAVIDPLAAVRIEPNNVRRVVRALEVYEHTGRPMSDWQQKRDPGFEFRVYGVDLPDEALDLRIADRVDTMLKEGLVEEVQSLLQSGIPANASSMSSIGYREAVRHLAGEWDLDSMREEIIRATRRLVRKQRQWFRRSDSRITWVSDSAEVRTHLQDFLPSLPVEGINTGRS